MADRTQEEQLEIEDCRHVLEALGIKKYGAALTERLMRGLAPITLLRVMCEDAIHDEWSEDDVAVVRRVLRVFRRHQTVA